MPALQLTRPTFIFCNWNHSWVASSLYIWVAWVLGIRPMQLQSHHGLFCLISYTCFKICGFWWCWESFFPELYDHEIDAQNRIQHILRKLASVSYIGQRVLLSVAYRISELAETLPFLDPFDVRPSSLFAAQNWFDFWHWGIGCLFDSFFPVLFSFRLPCFVISC